MYCKHITFGVVFFVGLFAVESLTSLLKCEFIDLINGFQSTTKSNPR